MPADLIVYALVAAGLVFWLRSILGTRHGDERQRPDPFTVNPEDAPKNAEANKFDEPQAPSAHEQIIELAENPKGAFSVDNKTAEYGLLEIARSYKSFDVTFFLQAAQDVFALVVEGFGKGDRALLKDLLGDEVYKAFDTAITEREKTGQKLENEIQAIRKAQIINAKLDGKKAVITVRFVATQTSVTRDKDDKIIEGNPDKVTEMRDVWTFARDIKSKDPRWFVTETRGDFDEDNDTIPNTHI